MKYVVAMMVLLLVGFLVWRRSATNGVAKVSVDPKAKKPPTLSPYRAVTIIPGPNACDAAKQLRDKRLLPNQVGAFPLEGCDKADCSCRFSHHDDRRDDDDRREPVRGFGVDNQLLEDRRDDRDRRSGK